MRNFWDYKASSVKQVREAVRELASNLGDPLYRISDFCHAVGIAQQFVKVDINHMKDFDVKMSYTIPDRMFRIEIEAERPAEVHRDRFAPVLRKYMRELKRVKDDSRYDVPYIG